MKIALLSASIVAGLALTNLGAQAQEAPMRPDFATLDADGDGQLTPAEMTAAGQARFAAMDSDEDGTISAAELAAALASNSEARAAVMLDRMDRNDDGVLQAEEMQPRGGDMMERMFARADADNSGAISAEEFEQARSRMEDRRGGRDGHGDKGNRQGGGGRHNGGHGGRG